MSLRLQVVTPILGGGSQTRSLDEVDTIRAATVRGHLRFWWRALNGHLFERSEDLYAAESALWGRAAEKDGGRSSVEIRIEVDPKTVGEVDRSNIDLQGTPGAYALWTAREETGATPRPAAPRRMPGTQFRLTLRHPVDVEKEIRDTVRAWLLFGGYGSRTRRGLGSLTLAEPQEASGWLPSAATPAGLATLFGENPLGIALEYEVLDTPLLAGAALRVGTVMRNGHEAWTTALNWLKDFRQGTNGDPGRRAREPGPQGDQRRPSISNWPEADKIRQLLPPPRDREWAHTPRHNPTPAWPRAGFGLPINGQFQTRDRQGNQIIEPGPFQLLWRSGEDVHDRFGSPLIVKALPLAGGGFVPCALWLNRAYPEGEVFLKGKPESGAPFDSLVAPGDTARFAALAGRQDLRQAFLDWLRQTHRTTVVAP